MEKQSLHKIARSFLRKLVKAFNIDRDCDHKTGIHNEDLHQHYSELLDNPGVIRYGRPPTNSCNFENPFWKILLVKSMDNFAISIDKVPKLVCSNTLKDTKWNSTESSDSPLK